MRKTLALLLAAYAVAIPAGAAFAASEAGEYTSIARPLKPMNPWYDSAKWKDDEGSFVGTSDTTVAQTRQLKKPVNPWYASQDGKTN